MLPDSVSINRFWRTTLAVLKSLMQTAEDFSGDHADNAWHCVQAGTMSQCDCVSCRVGQLAHIYMSK